MELKGQWVLRVTADGKTGSVSYSPAGRARRPGDGAGAQRRRGRRGPGDGVADEAGRFGRRLRLDLPGIGEIVVGEQPRARGSAGAPQPSGTSAEAAVDLVRIRLLGQDVRLGHMEAAVAVPPAGLTCPGLEVSMTPDTASVAARFRLRGQGAGP